VTAEYFPKKDRAYATSIFNAGASIGALFAPLTIPLLAKAWGWEMAFIVIGALGFVWMGFWVFMYKKPSDHPKVNAAELEYIEQDQHEVVDGETVGKEQEGEKISFWRTLSFKQTWAFAFGKFMTDGVWWFFLFWTPSYLNSQFGIKMSEGLGVALIFTLYAITMLSIYGGKLPTIIINKTGLNPYAARMRAMLIFAFIPLLVLLAQPMGTISPWFPIILIGLGGAAHQSWSANIFSTIGDMFPKSAIATVTGIGGGRYIGCVGAARGGEGYAVKTPLQPRMFHGTGDIFAAVLVGRILRGNVPQAAVQAAAAFVAECIRQTPEGADERLGVWLENALPKLRQE